MITCASEVYGNFTMDLTMTACASAVYNDTIVVRDREHNPFPDEEWHGDDHFDSCFDLCLWNDVSHRGAVIFYQEDEDKRIPEKLWYKKAVVNMENYNRHCFKWAVTRALFPLVRNPQWITKTLRRQTRCVEFKGIDFPTPLSQIETFEKNNGVLVNVFGWNEEERRAYPIRIPIGKHVGRVLLMLIGDESKGHYVVIRCMSRLLCGQTGKKRGKRFYCNNYLESFPSGSALYKHVACCEELDYPSCGFR